MHVAGRLSLQKRQLQVKRPVHFGNSNGVRPEHGRELPAPTNHTSQDSLLFPYRLSLHRSDIGSRQESLSCREQLAVMDSVNVRPDNLIRRFPVSKLVISPTNRTISVASRSTHVLHPSCKPHARFHMLWMVTTNTLCHCRGSLPFVGRTRHDFRLKMAGIPGLYALGGFFVAVGTFPFYPVALSDKNGVPNIFGIGANLLTFAPALICVLAELFFGFRLQAQAG